MAANIETQVTTFLREFESLVTAAHSAACATSDGGEGLPVPGSYATYYLTERLTIEYEALHRLLVRDVLPLVADIKAMGVRHG